MVLFKWIKLACFKTSSMGIPDHLGPSLPSFYSVLLWLSPGEQSFHGLKQQLIFVLSFYLYVSFHLRYIMHRQRNS